MIVVDVAPLSLGIETAGGIMTQLIDRKHQISCTKSEKFTSYHDNQLECLKVKENFQKIIIHQLMMVIKNKIDQ